MRKSVFYIALIIFAIAIVPISVRCNENEYYTVNENYEGNKDSYLLKGSQDSLVGGSAGEKNESTYLSPTIEDDGKFRLGYYKFEKIFKDKVVVDFRAKISENSKQSTIGFALREVEYPKQVSVYITNGHLLSQWRYYRAVIDFTAGDIKMYTSDEGFETLGLLSETAYRTNISTACDEYGMVGVDRIQFLECDLDDFSFYTGGSAPVLMEKPTLYRDGTDIKLLYSYYDSEYDEENSTEIRWQISDDGVVFENNENEYEQSYRLSAFDMHKYIRAIIIPKSVRYPETGNEYVTEPYYISSTVDVKLHDEKDNELTQFPDKAENLKAIIKFSPVEEADTVTAILAAYSKDGNMLYVITEEFERNPGDTSVEFNKISLKNLSEQVDYFKGYIWTDLKKIVPIDSIGQKNTEACELAKTALQKLNLEVQEFVEVNTLCKNGDWLGALRKYKKIFFDNLESFEENGLATEISGSISLADSIVENDTLTLTSDSSEKVQIPLGDAGNYNWIYPDITFLQYGLRLGWLGNLVYAYSCTGEEKYLKKWFDIWCDFDENFQNQYNNQISKGNVFCGVDLRFSKVGQLSNGGRINNRVDSLAFAVKKDRNIIERLFDDVSFAKMLIAQSEDLKDMYSSTATPNQFMYGVTAITKGEMIFPTLEVRNKLQEMNNNLVTFIEENYTADGGESEMSFHYNYDTFGYYTGLERLYKAKGDYPLWFTKFGEYIKNKSRLMSGVLTPEGNVPNLSVDYDNEKAYDRLSKYSYVTEDEVGSSIFSQIFGDKSSAPKFTSVAFPYTGYYAMRNSWDSDSQYIFFNGTRFGSGHTEMNKLEVQYHAYGERLLMSSPESYSNLDEDTPYNRYFASGYGNNTVMVDGYSQHRNINDTDHFSTPEKGLWHTSDSFDYADNIYENGYNTYLDNWDEREPVVTDVKHKRQVLMDKENIIALVVDEMQTEGEHDYSLIWNFDKKFHNSDMVTADGSSKKISAYANDGKAGLELYNFGKVPVSYQIACGEKEGGIYKGWYLPKYGTFYEESVHTETEFSGIGNQKIFTLLNPTEGGVSKIESYEEFENGAGFSIKLKNGTKIVCLSGNTTYGDINFSGNLLYLTINTNGAVKGVAIGTEKIEISGSTYTGDEKYFEFELKDRDITVRSAIEPVSGFSWNNGVPVYKE